MTVFVTGDSYLESSTAFSTRTTILDMSERQPDRPARAVRGRPRTASPSTRSTSTSGGSPSPRTRTASTRRWAPAASTTWSKATSREQIDAGPARRGRVPLALARREADRLQEPDRRPRPAGACASSTWRRSKTTPSPRRARSTTRSSGSTTTPSSTRTEPTSTRCPPTAAAKRSCWSRTRPRRSASRNRRAIFLAGNLPRCDLTLIAGRENPHLQGMANLQAPRLLAAFGSCHQLWSSRPLVVGVSSLGTPRCLEPSQVDFQIKGGHVCQSSGMLSDHLNILAHPDSDPRRWMSMKISSGQSITPMARIRKSA